MAGINLSQTESKPTTGFFDKGTITGALLLLITLSIFGGLRWYNASLEKESQALESLLSEKKAELEGERVNRLADVNNRVTYLAENPTKDSKALFTELERAIIPAVSLSAFSYRRDGNLVSFEAETASFKSLAQQIEAIRNTGAFSQVQTKEIARNEDGNVTFSLEATLVTSDKK